MDVTAFFYLFSFIVCRRTVRAMNSMQRVRKMMRKKVGVQLMSQFVTGNLFLFFFITHESVLIIQVGISVYIL